MPRGIIYVETTPVAPERSGEYHDWYDTVHLREVCGVDGIIGARRYAPTDGIGPYVAIYEIDCDDVDSAFERLREFGASGAMNLPGLLNRNPPPHRKVYREIASYDGCSDVDGRESR